MTRKAVPQLIMVAQGAGAQCRRYGRQSFAVAGKAHAQMQKYVVA
jgi:hypothetical protein